MLDVLQTPNLSPLHLALTTPGLWAGTKKTNKQTHIVKFESFPMVCLNFVPLPPTL